jgi:hypothetical protein
LFRNYRVNSNDLGVFQIFVLTKAQLHTEVKPATVEGLLQKLFFVECGRSYITPAISTRNTTVDTTAKWQLNLSKGFMWSRFPSIGVSFFLVIRLVNVQ